MDNELSDPQTAVFVFSGRLTTPTFGVSDVLALFGDEAVLDGLGLCTTAPCVGKAAIQREIERQRADNIRFTFISGTARLSADSFTRQIEIRSDSIRAVGVERIVAWHTTQVKGDRISAIHFSLDSNDPQTARFLAAPRVPARPPAAGVGAPAEGGFPVASVAITTLGGLLLAGAALWGRRGRPYQR